MRHSRWNCRRSLQQKQAELINRASKLPCSTKCPISISSMWFISNPIRPKNRSPQACDSFKIILDAGYRCRFFSSPGYAVKVLKTEEKKIGALRSGAGGYFVSGSSSATSSALRRRPSLGEIPRLREVEMLRYSVSDDGLWEAVTSKCACKALNRFSGLLDNFFIWRVER
jgi:hypothetical protein